MLWLLPITKEDVVRSAIFGVVIALGAIVLLDRYYAFYRLGTPWTSYALLTIAAPIASVLGAIIGVIALIVLARAGLGRRVAVLASVLVATLLFSAVFALEVHRTHAERTGEGEGAGRLAPFFRSLITFQ